MGRLTLGDVPFLTDTVLPILSTWTADWKPWWISCADKGRHLTQTLTLSTTSSSDIPFFQTRTHSKNVNNWRKKSRKKVLPWRLERLGMNRRICRIQFDWVLRFSNVYYCSFCFTILTVYYIKHWEFGSGILT
jgi:hypothetical protein